MRLSEIMKESAYKSFSIRYDELINEVKPYGEIIKTYLDKGDYIYRGMKNTGNVIRGDGSLLNRKSANTMNYVTMMSTFLPSWKGWPSRDKSFICSNTLGNSSGYGAVYHVIPIENQQIAVASSYDFWNAFDANLGKYSIFDVYELNIVLDQIFNYYKIDTDVENNPKDFMEAMTNIQAEMRAMADEDFATLFKKIRVVEEKFFEDFKNTPVIQFFDKMLNPAENGCQLFDNFTVLPNSDKSKEIWMTGKVIFIHNDHIETFLKHFGGKSG
jgi:hypothetical protein